MSRLTEAIIQAYLGPATSGIRGTIRQDFIKRGNTPSAGVTHMVATRGRPIPRHMLPIVDRVLEPQTIAHFLSFAVNGHLPGHLPGGGQTTLPLLGEDLMLITTPYSAWAAPPFNQDDQPAIAHIMQAIGSFQDSSRLQCISKDLHAMKSRLWEGLMPVSERRWTEKRLDDPCNFSAACQVISLVLHVFQYLNLPPVKNALRGTYNIIYGHLERFETAVNAKRTVEGREALRLTALWAEYMRAHYAYMENRTHLWVTQKIRAWKDRVLRDLQTYQPAADSNGVHDALQWKLMDMWQDLTDNQSWADFAIFLPMDGYRGCTSALATGRPVSENPNYSGTSPVVVSTDINKRRQDYHERRKQLNLVQEFEKAMLNVGLVTRRPLNDPDALAELCVGQSEAQDQTRLELRGESPSLGEETWVKEAEHQNWGYVAYRNCYDHSDAEWDDFKNKFETDASGWGKELVGAEDLRARSKIHWLDPRELGIEGDVAAMKKNFSNFKGSESFPENYFNNIFLVADKASIDSYLHPLTGTSPENFPHGDFGGFVLAVDPDFDPEEENTHSEESPGYSGEVRILASLLWDDLGAMNMMQTQGLFDIWPLAMKHPLKVYVGPVVKAQQEAWVRLLSSSFSVLAALLKWQRDHGQSAGTSSGQS